MAFPGPEVRHGVGVGRVGSSGPEVRHGVGVGRVASSGPKDAARRRG